MQRKTFGRPKPPEVKVPCPCGRVIYKVKNPKKGTSIICKCKKKLVLDGVGGRWFFLPADNEWVIWA